MALSGSQKMTSAEVNTLFSRKQKKYIKDNLSTVKSKTVIFFKTNEKKLYFSGNSWVAKWYGYNSVELSNCTTVDENGTVATGIFHRSGVDLDGNYKVIKTSKLYEENGYVNTGAFNNSGILDQLANFVFFNIKKGAVDIAAICKGTAEISSVYRGEMEI